LCYNVQSSLNIKDVNAKNNDNLERPYTFHSDFSIIDTLGQGGQGTVYKVQRKSDRRIFAIKETIQNEALAVREVGSLKELHRARHRSSNHVGMNRIPRYESHWSEIESKRFYILMEHFEGESLREWLKRHKNRTQGQSLYIFKQIVEGVNFMHRCHIVHRDLKPDNILITGNNHVKIVDFGCSKKMFVPKPNDRPGVLEKHSLVGSENYGSPEILEARYSYTKATSQEQKLELYKAYYDHTTDVYSLGIILAELLYPITLHEGMLDRIRKWDFGKSFGEAETTLLKKMLNLYPDQRPHTDSVLNDPLFRSCGYGCMDGL